MMTGRDASASSCRSRRSRPKPSSSGIITSVRIEVRRLALGGGQRGRAVGDRLDLPARLEDPPHVVAHVGVVVGEQDRARRAVPAAACRRRGSALASGSQRNASATYAAAPVARRRQRPLGADPFGGQVGAAARDRDRERRPAAQARAHGHRAAVQPHQLVHQRQADPRAFVRARARARARGGSARTGAAARARECRCRCRATASSTCSPRTPSVTAIEPSNVNLNAFDSRLRTIFSHMSRSTKTGSRSGGQSTRSSRPARSIAERKPLARSRVIAARSVG